LKQFIGFPLGGMQSAPAPFSDAEEAYLVPLPSVIVAFPAMSDDNIIRKKYGLSKRLLRVIRSLPILDECYPYNFPFYERECNVSEDHYFDA
jgi:hypothetical protein